MNDDINDGTNYSDDNGSYARLSQAYIEPNLPYNIEETKAWGKLWVLFLNNWSFVKEFKLTLYFIRI